jgi:hypothetical protein
MDRFDEMIGRALTEEDRALLARHGEQGYVTQALGMFRGPFAGVMRLVYVTVLLSSAGAIYALWRMGTATDALTAVQWGIGALFLFQVTALSKGYMGSHLEANRTLRELKRLELQLALLRDAGRA